MIAYPIAYIMEEDSCALLLKLVKEPGFDVIVCIGKLKDYNGNIGAHHFLVNQLYRFSYSEIEFCIPQFIQLLVSYETESMALWDFLLYYSEQFPHFCLITFWHLQAYIFDLKDDPESYSFHIARNFINDLQNIMFNHQSCDPVFHKEKNVLRENLHPALVMCGSMLASIALPEIQLYSKPIIKSQGRQQKSFLFKLANFHKALTKNLTLKNRESHEVSLERQHIAERSSASSSPVNVLEEKFGISRKPSESTATLSRARAATNGNDDHDTSSLVSGKTKFADEQSKSFEKGNGSSNSTAARGSSSSRLKENTFSHSMPNLTSSLSEQIPVEDLSITPVLSNSSSVSLASFEQQELGDNRNIGNVKKHLTLLYDQQVKLLQSNYFNKETEFMMALQNVSIRLSQVPKEARLTTLRAELSIINKTALPSEIDIPQLFENNSKQNRKLHRILKLNVNEACVLNSAERVPFLLLVEYLNEDMDFDPFTERNRNILLNNLDYEKPYNDVNKQRVLSSDSTRRADMIFRDNSYYDKDVGETDLGDISVVALSNEQSLMNNHLTTKQREELSRNINNSVAVSISPEAKVNASSTSHGTEQRPISDLISSSKSSKDLSTQIRIAGVMLQQLEKSSRVGQSASIKTRIIESMQSLQDNFEHVDYHQIRELQNSRNRVSSSDAGERKLENDFKLSEDWTTKKNRIRQRSTYGHLKNWDLCSVIAKSGDDLPQEALACQLILLISNVWKKHNIGVWTKNMKILITSANTGLVETINNAMSVHSIKKTLTDLSLKRGENPKGKVASLKEYFEKVYGREDSYKYKKARDNFARSLAAYSIICYVLQIKDRHNGNIMLDSEGHIIHIDFGFLLSNSPGSVGFEKAPFKLTFEYVELLGGTEGKPYMKFKTLCKECFKCLRKNCDHLISIVDVMQKDSTLPCFENGAQTSTLLKQRMQMEMTDEEVDNFVENVLIGKSVGSVYTRLYDQFQLLTQGIYN